MAQDAFPSPNLERQQHALKHVTGNESSTLVAESFSGRKKIEYYIDRRSVFFDCHANLPNIMRAASSGQLQLRMAE